MENNKTPSSPTKNINVEVGNITDSKAIAIGTDIHQTIYEGYTAEQVAALLADARKIEIPLPPEPTSPPTIGAFFGREDELSQCAERIQSTGVLAVAGMPGVGKTALVVRLLEQLCVDEKIFWHTLHQGESALSLIWELAAFLGWHRQTDLWNLLQGALLAGGQPPPVPVLMDYLSQALDKSKIVICLDDLHAAYDDENDDPVFEQLLHRLKSLANAGNLQLIVISRTAPSLDGFAEITPLTGLRRNEISSFIKAQQVELSPEQLDRLYTSTEGNVTLLMLAVQALAKARQPDRILEKLVESQHVEQFLLTEVDKTLSKDEQMVMNGVAAFLGYPATRDAIETALDGHNIRRTLIYLVNRYLLTPHESDFDREYSTHTIVREFYYEYLSRKERKDLHQRVADYYASEDINYFRAAEHYLKAGNHPKAAELASTETQRAAHRGLAGVLRRLLMEIDTGRLEPSLHTAVVLSLGEINHFFRYTQDAKDAYLTALAQLEAVPTAPSSNLQRAYVCRRMAELVMYDAPQEGLAWVEQGLGLLPDDEQQERINLLLQQGGLYAIQGDLEKAEKILETALAAASPAVTQQNIDLLTQLGTVYSLRGKLDEGRAATEKALSLTQKAYNPLRQALLLMNLGLDRDAAGDLVGAERDLRTAMELADQLGMAKLCAEVRINLGDLLIRTHELEEAETVLTSGLALAEKSAIPRNIIAVHINLAHLARAQNRACTAASHLDVAEPLAKETEHGGFLDEIAAIRTQLDK